MGYEFGLAFWGSPHFSEATDDGCSKYFKSSAQFKTCAFESLSWLCPQALVVMTFTDCYQTEFWSPTFNRTKEHDFRTPRELRIMEGHFR
eukprot:3532719-Pyramimonas_sp.AAC.1